MDEDEFNDFEEASPTHDHPDPSPQEEIPEPSPEPLSAQPTAESSLPELSIHPSYSMANNFPE